MIKNNEKLVISKTSKELILIDLSLIFALCLCLFGVIKSFPIVYSIIINNFQINNSEYGQTFIFILSTIMSLILLYMIIQIILQLIFKIPSLIFDEEGIKAHGALRHTSILWNKCVEYRFMYLYGQYVINIKVKDQKDFMRKTNVLIRAFFVISQKRSKLDGMEFGYALLRGRFYETSEFISRYLTLAEDSE